MTNTTARTPGPWTLETVRTSVGICHKIGPFPPRNGRDEPTHACIYVDYPSESPRDKEMLANAAFIVRAANSHDELVAALEAVLKAWDLVGAARASANDKLYATDGIIRAALAKARQP